MSEKGPNVTRRIGQNLYNRLTGRWRSEFPYHWDADDMVSRRQLLNFAVYASGALFASTGILAFLGLIEKPRAYQPQIIANARDLAEGQALYFRYPGPDDGAVLLHLADGRFVAYSQKCTHLSCSVYFRSDRAQLLCPCHNGVFNPLTGDPVAGPPSRRLPQVLLRQEDDSIYAVGVEL